MAVPAPVVPSGNAYSVNVAAAMRPDDDLLPDFARATAPLLRPWKVPVRMHVAGDSPALTALRESLARAGAKCSGFSPAPSPDVPGEGFWKSTFIVAEGRDGDANFWAHEREEKKVGWDPLLITLRRSRLPAGLSTPVVASPDLWCVDAGDADAATVLATRDAWMNTGAGAVAVLGKFRVAWASRNAVFGRSSGALENGPSRPEASLGDHAARITAALVEELLGENLFDKTLIRADRECLEMRPLRLGRACGAPHIPASPWGSLGRKERHELAV